MLTILTLLFAGVVVAQSCDANNPYGYEEFEPYFFMQEMGNTPPTCNIDPSQASFDYAVAVGGEFCLTMSDPVTISMAYTGTDGLLSTAVATTLIAETSTSSLDLVFTGLPASAISNGSPITVTVYDTSVGQTSYCAPYTTTSTDYYVGADGSTTSTSTETDTYNAYTTSIATQPFASTYVATQTFVPTLLFTDTTVTSTSTVPSTTTSTSTITQVSITQAPASTTTITTSSGTNTVIGTASTTTLSKTVSQKIITKTNIVKVVSTTSSSCVAAASQRVKKRELPPSRWIGAMPAAHANRVAKRQSANAGSTSTLSYITGYCSSPLTTTTIYTSTSVIFPSTVTDSANVTTSTAYAVTTSTSTFSPTATVYKASMGTTTVTPTVTRRTTIVLTKSTTTVTYTTAITKTKYPKNPPVCATPTAK